MNNRNHQPSSRINFESLLHTYSREDLITRLGNSALLFTADDLGDFRSTWISRTSSKEFLDVLGSMDGNLAGLTAMDRLNSPALDSWNLSVSDLQASTLNLYSVRADLADETVIFWNAKKIFSEVCVVAATKERSLSIISPFVVVSDDGLFFDHELRKLL